MRRARIRRATTIAAVAILGLATGTAAAAAPAAPGTATAAAAENFSLVVFPDTQYGAQSYPGVFDAQGKWVAENAESRNIAYAIHNGDVVDDSDDTTQWTTAKNAMGWLEGNVPYLIGAGNHDMDAMPNGEDPKEVRDATAFNENFPRSQFADLPGFGGTLPEDGNDNSYHTFTAGGTDWLILALKYAPTDEELAWGNDVIADHPDHQVIVATHAYQKGTEKDDTGKKVWDELASKHANVSFVFSGHYTAQGMIEEEGDHGNTVYQIQADYQVSDERDPNSYLRVLEFNPTDKTVAVETYSPYLDDNLTDDDNQFTINDFTFLPAH